MPCRQLSLHLVELLKSGGSVGYFHAGGCLEVLTGFVIVAFESRKDSGGVDCRGSIAGFCDVALCYSIVSTAHGYVCGVEVGDFAFRIHAHCGLEYLVVYLTSRFYTLGGKEEFLKRQLLRTCLDQLKYFVDITERADVVFNAVVGMAQCRIYFGQQESILLRVCRFYSGVFCVGFKR